ncbi:asparagine synthase C-terminal domain-containing protein, partial [Oharaeibacter diazotrophicus]
GPSAPRRWFSLAATIAAAESAPAPDPADVPALVREALRDSVAAHLVADVPVGLFLSAGVDSGALSGLMRDAGAVGTTAVTLAYDDFRGTARDEAPLAATVAARYGARHVVRTVGAAEYAEDLPRILAAMDQPSVDGVNTWFVAKATRELGLKVALTGAGGDELLGGYDTFHRLPRMVRRVAPFAAVPGIAPLADVAVRALRRLGAPLPAKAA